jgi:hypothetical protein
VSEAFKFKAMMPLCSLGSVRGFPTYFLSESRVDDNGITTDLVLSTFLGHSLALLFRQEPGNGEACTAQWMRPGSHMVTPEDRSTAVAR